MPQEPETGKCSTLQVCPTGVSCQTPTIEGPSRRRCRGAQTSGLVNTVSHDSSSQLTMSSISPSSSKGRTRCSVDPNVVPALQAGCFATKPNSKDESPHRHVCVCRQLSQGRGPHCCSQGFSVFRHWRVPRDPGGLWERSVYQHGGQLPVRVSRGVLL